MLAVADSTLIAKDVTGVVFVVNTQTTGRDAARVAIERLESAGARFFGAVLNRANITRHEYYFDPYYRRSYGEYYGREAQGGLSPRGSNSATRSDTAPAAAAPGPAAAIDAIAMPARRRPTNRPGQPSTPRAGGTQITERNN